MRGQYLNWDSKKDLNRSLTLLKSKYFLILVIPVKILVKRLSDFNSLSTVIPNSLTVLFSYIISSLILAHFVQICFLK